MTVMRNPTQLWTEWLREHGSRLMLYARQQTRCEADAEDVLQMALVKTWKTHDGPPNDRVISLTYTNVRRCAIDLARSDQRRLHREDRAMREMGETVSWFELPDDDESRMLQVAMTKIPEKFREVVTLKVWGDLTFQQISEMLDIPVNTAASRYRYGLEALRKIVAQDKELFHNS